MTDRGRLNLMLLPDLARSVVELALARLRLGSLDARRLVDRAAPASSSLTADQAALANRVAYIVPRVAARLPWRADCLVQALAAQRWLRGAGIMTNIHVGVPNQRPATFEAHAWLTAGELVVTGGDIAKYQPFLKS